MSHLQASSLAPESTLSSTESEFPISSYSKAAERWVEPHLPAKAMVKWLEALANALLVKFRQNENWKEIKEMIRECFNNKKLSNPSKLKYMSYLKSLLIENGVLLNPYFTPHLEAVCSKYFKNRYLTKLFEQQSTNYARWRLWTHLQFATPRDVPQAHKLFLEPYLCRDFWVSGDILGPNLRKDVEKVNNDRLLTRQEVKIDNKTEFLQTTLRPLTEKDTDSKEWTMGDLFCALLLACGRRPSTLHLSLDRWALVPGKEDMNCILFLETLKKRGHMAEPAEIPLLCTGRVFLKALKRFQKKCRALPRHVPNCDETKAQALYGALQREWCRDCHAGKFKPKDFRAVYSAYVASSASRSREGLSGPAAVSKALVHTIPQTAVHYLHVNLTDENSKTDTSSLNKSE